MSKYPQLSGRFVIVSGIEFAFDPSKPAGKRIDPRIIKIKDEYLDYQKVNYLKCVFLLLFKAISNFHSTKDYKLGVKSYLKEGKDGFTMFKNCPVLVS